jgi:hypothetical protein
MRPQLDSSISSPASVCICMNSRDKPRYPQIGFDPTWLNMPVMSCGVGTTRTRGDHDARVSYYSVEIRPGADVQYSGMASLPPRSVIYFSILAPQNGLADTAHAQAGLTHELRLHRGELHVTTWCHWLRIAVMGRGKPSCISCWRPA